MDVVEVVDMSTPPGVLPGSSTIQAAPHPLPTWRDQDSPDDGAHVSVGDTKAAACNPGPAVSVQNRFAAIAEEEVQVAAPDVHFMSEGSAARKVLAADCG